MACFNSNFDIGNLVYLKTDPNQLEWMVLQVRFCVDGTSYFLARGCDTYWAYDIELSNDKDLVKALT